MKKDAYGRSKGYFVFGLFLLLLGVIFGPAAADQDKKEAILGILSFFGLVVWVAMFLNLMEAKGYPRAVGWVALTIIGALVLVFLPDKSQDPAHEASVANTPPAGSPASPKAPIASSPPPVAQPTPPTDTPVAQGMIKAWDCPECGNRNSGTRCLKCGYTLIEDGAERRTDT